MARIKSKRGEGSMELQMTPMIDVIFQLLIFFMCVTHFKSLEGKFLAHMPKEVGLHEPPPPHVPLDEVRIRLIYDDTAPIKTRIRVKLTADEYSLNDWDELYRDMANKHEQHRSVGISGKIPFIIDPEPKVPLQAVAYALNACRKAQIADISFAAKSPVDRPLE